MGDFPSGQRGQTVNLLSLTSVVRIHHLPPKYPRRCAGISFFLKKSACSFPSPKGRFGQDSLRECARLFRPHPSLARHLPHPGGRLFSAVHFFTFYFSTMLLPTTLIYRRCIYQLRTAAVSLPLGGEGGASAPDEGEIGERST